MSLETLAQLQAESRRLTRLSFRWAVGLLAILGVTQVLGWAMPRTLWALALLQLGNASLAVSDYAATRPRLYGVLMWLSKGAGITLLAILVLDLLSHITA